MGIGDFFENTLGAPLKNKVWSWGAFKKETNQVFLRLWEDDLREIDGNEFIRILLNRSSRLTTKGQVSPGYTERKKHIELLRGGSQGYGVLGVAKKPSSNTRRETKEIDNEYVLKLGKLITIDNELFAEIVARIHVNDLGDDSNTISNLQNDVVIILNRDIDNTEKQTLVSARIGQGRFRKEVLDKWDNRCAVTGIDLTTVIRASHIKPWKNSSDKERLDPDNGLPLVATLDALFDVGLISFADSGELLTSSKLSDEQIDELHLRGRHLSQKPNKETCQYLEHHRHAYGFP